MAYPQEQIWVSKSKRLSQGADYRETLVDYNQNTYTLYHSQLGYPLYTLYIGFNAPSDSLKFNGVMSITVSLKIKPHSGYSNYAINVYSNNQLWNANDNGITGGTLLTTYSQDQLPADTWTTVNITVPGAQLKNVLRYGIHVTGRNTAETGKTQNFVYDIDAAVANITATFYAATATTVLKNVFPARDTRVDRTKPIMVSAETSTIEPCYEVPRPTRYKIDIKDSAGNEYTNVNSGTWIITSINVPIPANTITKSGAYKYRLTVWLNSGDSINSGYIDIISEDAVPTAPTNLVPNGTFENGAQPIKFSWQHNIETGTEPTQSVITYTTNGADWTRLISVPGPATETEITISKDKLFNGQFWWKVQTVNIDGIASPYSEAAKFTVINAPDPPKITSIISTPCISIEWSAVEQYAYEIIIDGKVVKREFGSAKKWESDELYPSGSHEIKVSVQGGTGLWSAYTVINVEIANAPYGSINLTVTAGDFANLRWTSNYAHDEYWIYRDGTRIGKTTGTTYTDEYAAGRSSYEVRGVKRPATNYTPSNAVTIDVKCSTMIKNINAAEWLPLILSDTVHRTERISKGRNVNVVHMAGRKYPEAQLSEHYSESVQVTCALDNVESKRILEALAGEIVVIKTNKGRTCTGIMTDIAISDGQMYTVYQFTVVRLNGVPEYE